MLYEVITQVNCSSSYMRRNADSDADTAENANGAIARAAHPQPPKALRAIKAARRRDRANKSAFSPYPAKAKLFAPTSFLAKARAQ